MIRWLLALWALARFTGGGAGRYVDGRPPRWLWWDISRRETPPASELAPQLARLGVSRLIIEVQSEAQPAAVFNWSPAEIAAFSADCARYHIGIEAMVWPRPTPDYLAGLARWIEAARVPVQVDLEGRWSDKNLAGFRTMEAAGVALGDALDATGVPWSVTTHPGRTAILAPIIRRAGYLAVQAYSVSTREAPGYELGGPYGPGNLQRYAARKARDAGARRVVIGLPLYGQLWPGAVPADTLATAERAAAAERPDALAWWSAKHALGASANRYAAPYLENTRS